LKNGKNFTKEFSIEENSKFKIKFQHHLQRKLTKEEGENFNEEKKNSIHYKKNSMQMEANLYW
jgi:divalent metal cation (Fe/Co/Zn/Cd) transporter